VALIIGAILYLIFKKLYSPERQISKRVEDLSKTSTRKLDEKEVPFIIREEIGSELPGVERFLARWNIAKKLEKLLRQADSKLTVSKLIIQMMFFGIIGMIAGLVLKSLIFTVLFLLVLGLFPVFIVWRQKVKRTKAFIRTFPDALDMMTSAIKAGHALNQSIHLVGTEAPDPVGIEFKITFERYNLGLDLKEALIELTERVDSIDLKLFVTAVLLQRETGGNLTEILDKISYTIRERFKLIGQIKTYTAQGRMSAWLLGTMPIVFVCIISVLNPEYLKPLFRDKIGHYLIALSSTLQVIGFIMIQKIVRISYK
jgi:tight adherence protein B